MGGVKRDQGGPAGVAKGQEKLSVWVCGGRVGWVVGWWLWVVDVVVGLEWGMDEARPGTCMGG